MQPDLPVRVKQGRDKQRAQQVGRVLAVGVVCLGPLLGRSATAAPHQRRLLLTAMILLDAITAVWILAQYAFEVRCGT